MWCGETDFPCQSVNEADKHLKHALPSTIEVQTSAVLHSELDLTHDITKITSGSGEKGRVWQFDVNSEMSFDAKATIYCSLVALVKAEYPFDKALQDRCVQFLKSLEPKWSFDQDYTAKLVTDLVPSSAGSSSGFVPSIVTLLSLPHSIVVEAALSFLSRTTQVSSSKIQNRLVVSDLVPNLLATFQPHTLPFSQNETILYNLIRIINDCIDLALPWSLRELRITAEVDKLNHREMIFQRVVLPSSQYVTLLISTRPVLNEDFFRSFMSLLCTHVRICPFHRPTLEFVLASPIVMTFSSCLSFIERDGHLFSHLNLINHSLKDCESEGREVAQSAKRMIQALFSEGFEDTLDQKMMNDKDGNYGLSVVSNCHSISKLLGSNVKRL
ncbi:hypothetical protein BLNAU_7217 [Blattamonas nauphoetae]|uniref:Uncharacterized protein n=1 Tax=Blattamonas nauphoetae TaxID=2049346 RepID=A0ABQ9Y212_9EUKA|nr:hypothetical protein BLNAU_7217 [Blattamonas nauphoetae]